MTQVYSSEYIKEKLYEVCDPEIPVLSIVDLGIIRDVDTSGPKPIITITPTYSGCPAMSMIEMEMRTALLGAGILEFEIKTILYPPWTTDWISTEGRSKLFNYGIAPPEESHASKLALFSNYSEISCPQCRSRHTEMVSRFGSTACKAMYKCLDCKEPFDYFKCL